MNFTIEKTTTDNVNFKILEKMLDNELYEIYGEMQDNYSQQNIVMNLKTIIVYDNKNPIACGCLKFLDNNFGEVKRVFVASDYRGKGVAQIIVKEIEKLAFEANVNTLILQTGCKQSSAINLYRKMGYVIIDNYGPYVEDDNSICMKKILN